MGAVTPGETLGTLYNSHVGTNKTKQHGAGPNETGTGAKNALLRSKTGAKNTLLLMFQVYHSTDTLP